jgi:ABC-2 type transport system ATP-binding protein
VNANPSLRAVRLTKRFGSFTALNNLNLSLEGAKCVGFLGHNGAGKMTALKMFTNMLFPSEGEAYINGIDVRRERKRALAGAGVLIETPEIYPSLTPREALRMVADLRGVPAAEQRGRIDTVLAEVKMSEWADSKVGRFSKGMKQRVNIAASLVHDPQVVLLDEPTTGLDPRGMAEVRSIIRELKRGNRLVFMSSHILSEVSDVCDEVAFLNRGQLLFYNTLAQLTATASAAGSTVYDLAFRRPLDDATVQTKIGGLSGISKVERLGPDRLRVYLSKGPDDAEPVLSELAALRLGLLSFAESESALEQTYLRLIEKGD